MTETKNNYVPYHIHTDYSLLDSCTKPEQYVEYAKELGIKAMAFTEHGKISNWTEKWNLCKEAGIKYIHGVEIYLTESFDEKVRDNYHTILLAKNMDGLRELNSLVSLSFDETHFYYTNRLSFEEFLHISNNIISTSACLASPLNKLNDDNVWYEQLVQKYDFLEVQAHNHPEQAAFNKRLLELSKKYNKPLIVGTDTHSLNEYKAMCRKVLLKAKHKSYGDEDAFDLTFKTYDELVEMFNEQGALPEKEFMKAIENTNILDEMTEEIDLDLSIKYPILYGSREKDIEKFKENVETMFQDKLDKGIISKEREKEYREALEDEYAVFRKLDMEGFMLSQSEITKWCKDSGICLGPGRGSVGGSLVAYVTDITEVDPKRWGTIFSRFANEDRVEIGDIDTDCLEEDRPRIFKYIIDRFGTSKTARVASFGTLQDKAVIDEIGRAFSIEFAEKFPDVKNPWSLDKIASIKKEYEKDPESTRLAYKDLFTFFDGLLGTKISQSIHPAGIVISPITLPDNFGVFDKEGELCLMLDMDNIHDFTGLAKYDMLILKTVGVIKDTCKYIDQQYPRMWDMDFGDIDVWDDMSSDLSMIFQFESPFAADCFKKFQPRSIEDMSIVTAAVRPSGTSYRDDILARKVNKNPSEMIDKLLEKNLGFLVFQEDTTRFLTDICGFSGGEADTVRRGIGRKKKEILDAAMPKIKEGYCNKSDKPREVAEKEIDEFIQIVEDSARYQFNYSHAAAYSMVGFLCGYYRHYYPLEFITSYLNNAANEADIKTGTDFAKRRGIKITMPKWGISRSDYYFDKERNTISKGLASIKYIGGEIAEQLYDLSQSNEVHNFMELLMLLNSQSKLNSKQLDILIKIDFFSEFGNQRELLYIVDIFSKLFKKGEAKQINKNKVAGHPIEPVIQKYSVGTTKSGSFAASYTLLDIDSILFESEDIVKAMNMPDLSVVEKVDNYAELIGDGIYVSGEENDRRKLYVTDVKPLVRKSDGHQFGYSVFTSSIGSGVEARFTVKNRMFDMIPLKKKDIIYCERWHKDKQYFVLDFYSKIDKSVAINQ